MSMRTLATSATAVFSSKVGFGVASPVNSLRWISPYKLEHSFLAMDVSCILCTCMQAMVLKEFKTRAAFSRTQTITIDGVLTVRVSS